MKQFQQYQDMLAELYPPENVKVGDKKVLSRTFTFKVTDDCNLRCTYCFASGTKIAMADDTEKSIENIGIGDKILAFDEFPCADDISLNVATVEQLYKREATVISITLSDDTVIRVTPNHLLLKRDCTWIEAGKLRTGDYLYGFSDKKKKIRKVVKISDDEIVTVYNIGTSSKTYIANGVCSHNCYQSHKSEDHRMTWEVAKETVDMLLTGKKGMKDYIDPSYSPGIILEFIGGEPFLEIDLIDRICDYFVDQAILLQHPWAEKFAISICSNGVLYFDERVQKFLNKYRGKISFSVTIDGNKDLHDSCRIFPDGSPSYDLAVAAAKDWMDRGYYMGSKITIAPENVMHVTNAIKHMVSLGYTEIMANCVYEEGWTPVHATVLYNQMKELSDFFLEENLDFEKDYYCSLYEENFFVPKEPEDNDNWCFRAGTMILTPNGNVPIETLSVGDEVVSGSGAVRKITDIKMRVSNDTVAIKAYGVEPIYTTCEHPFLTEGGIWKKAKDLTITDKLVLYTGELVSVENVDFTVESYKVYNLTVEVDHTFIANEVVVHNCGGIGEMLAVDYAGRFFPCIRYMEDSLAGQQEPYCIGDINVGVCVQQCDKDKLKCLTCITRRSQSTDECFYCPIANGCSWWITPTIVVTL